MFSNDIDKRRFPPITRVWGMFIGTLVMIAAPLCLVSPGTLEISMPILLLACLVVAAKRGNLRRVLMPLATHGTKMAAALMAFAALSALWSDKPLETLNWVGGTTVVALGAGIGARYMLLEPRSSALHVAEGLWIGFLVGLLYLGIEALTDQWIKITVYNLLGIKQGHLKPIWNFTWDHGRLVAIAIHDLTRSFTSVPLMLWGVLLAILGTLRAGPASLVAVGTYLFTAVVLMVGSNETAKVALLIGTLSFVLATFNARWSSQLLRVTWVVACLAIVPITLGLYRANLHNMPWVQPTAQHRIVIWNRFTEETMKRPILGVGAGMAYWNYDPNKQAQKGEPFTRFSRDVHCVYLQIWFELGVFGAILLSLLGLTILQRLDRLPASAVPYAHAAFTSAATTMASSYGLWRPWFNLTFAVAVFAFAIGLRAIMRREHVLAAAPDSARLIPAWR